MSTIDTAGLQEAVTIDGVALTGNPEDISVSEEYLETSRRFLSGQEYTDGAYAFDKQPVRMTKYTLQARWSRIKAADYLLYCYLRATARYFRVCLWKREIALFNGTGTETQFRLPRTIALDVQTPPSVDLTTRLATEVWIGTGPLGPSTTRTLRTTGITISAPDSEGRTLVTLSPAPAAGEENVAFVYAPQLYMRLRERGAQYTGGGSVEPQTLTLAER